MLNVDSEVVSSPKLLLNLWRHECSRVIADRFVTPTDCEWLDKQLKISIEEDCGQEMAGLLDVEPYFVDFLRDAPEPTGNNNFA